MHIHISTLFCGCLALCDYDIHCFRQEKEKPSAERAKTLQEQDEDRASRFTLPPGIETSSWSKSTERVVKPGGVHDAAICFAERTMHFGLFCVAIMYFRAKWLLYHQRKGTAHFKLGWDVNTNVPVRAQRKATGHHSVNSTQAGYQRVKVSSPVVLLLF